MEKRTITYSHISLFICGDEQHKAGDFEMDYPFEIDQAGSDEEYVK